MKSSLIILLTIIESQLSAATYYISTSRGLDSRTSTQARNSSTPWQTITKVNATMLAPGDSVLFKRGETFYGSLVVGQSGTSRNPIVFSAYGTGKKPIITGLTTLSSWTSIGGGKYESTLSTPPTNQLNLVVFNNALQPIGRYPKAGLGERSYFKAGSVAASSRRWTNSDGVITSSVISGIPSFVGGEMVDKPQHWVIDRSDVSAQTSTTVTYAKRAHPVYSSVSYPALATHGFYFQNHVNACTTLGDWCYNQTTKKITMYFGANTPSNYTVQVATKDYLVNILNKNYIRLSDLQLVGANQHGIKLDGATYCSFLNLNVKFIGTDGVNVNGNNFYATNNNTIDNCSLSYINNDALALFESPSWTVTNNTITQVGMIIGMGQNGDDAYQGMGRVKGIIKYNDVSYTGNNGIYFEGDNTIVRRNHVHHYCSNINDGGGIYTFGTTGINRSVDSNIVHDGFGHQYGLGAGPDAFIAKTSGADTRGGANVFGIYMDGNTSATSITNNTVYNVAHGAYYINAGADNISLSGNTAYGGVWEQIYVVNATNIHINNNIFFAPEKQNLVAKFATALNSLTANNNYYCRPISEQTDISSKGYSTFPFTYDNYHDGGIIECPDGRFRSLDTWKTYSGKDGLSAKTIAARVTHLSQIRFELNATKVNKKVVLDANYVDVKGAQYSGTTILPPYTSLILLKTSATPTTPTVPRSRGVKLKRKAR
jgi:hypothetical protein